MTERAVRFGRATSLAGVVTEPESGATAELPAVILLNSGILHHVGASRLHVQIARRLAEEGFLTIRFDFGGIGDSEVRRDSLPFEKSAVLEAQEAMDFLAASRGARHFVLAGLCSGADMAFRTAGADPRVVGVVQMDAWAYRTPGYYLRHYAKRVGRPEVWRRWLARRAAGILPRTAAPAAGAERTPDMETPEYRRRFPPREQVAADLNRLLERRVELLYVFSGGQEEHINHREQYRRSFRDVDFLGRLQVEFLGDADHLFTGLDHQRFLLDRIAEWARAHWERPPLAAASVPLAAADPRPRRVQTLQLTLTPGGGSA